MKKLTGLMVLGLLFLLGTSPVHAIPYVFVATLDGPSENPPTPSAGTGFARVILDDSAHTLSIDVTFSGLTGTTTAAHIHCCVAAPGNAGIATPGVLPGFPLGVTSGTYFNVFDTQLDSTFSSGFLTANGGTAAGAEAALLAGLQAGMAYFNIHTSFRTGGEIRGFLAVPEPGTLGLLLLGLGALGVRGARRSH